MYWSIAHKDLAIHNPTSVQKIEEVCEVLSLPSHARVIDIGCGTGEFLIHLVGRYQVSGVGVDVSPFMIEEAKQRHKDRVPQADLLFIQMDGSLFMRERSETFDLAVCLGASNAFGGYKNTLLVLREMVRPGALVVIGAPYWLHVPAEGEEILALVKIRPEGTYYQNVVTAKESGMEILYIADSSQHDWDRYEGHQWRSVEMYATEHNDDNAPYFLSRIRKSKDTYLKWRRDNIGWAIYVFRTEC